MNGIGNAGENRSGGRRQHHRVAGKEGAVASAGASVDSKDVSLQGKDRGTQQHRHKRPAHHDKSGADKQHHKHGDHKHSERSRGKFQDKPYVKKSHPHSEKQGSHHASKHKKPTTVVGKVKNFFKNLFG